MLRSMKQKFGSKTTKGNSVSRDDPAPQQNSRQTAASTSGISGRAGSLSRNNSLPVREKIPQPSLDPASAQQYYADTLPSFRDVPNSEKQALFIKKLHLCAFTFDFTDQSKNVREKEVKRQTLLELADYINQKDGAKFTDSVAEDVIFMLNNNLFRALPATKSHDMDNTDPDEEEPTLEPAWPHLQVLCSCNTLQIFTAWKQILQHYMYFACDLQIVYEFLLRYVCANDTDAKIAKKYVDQSFVVRLLELFDSEDPRERDYLKTILHRIYGKFMVHRPFVRKAINNVFYRFVFETEHHNGIAELLEILGSIINGFALPLKDEHKVCMSCSCRYTCCSASHVYV